ncbi:hypothetical protein E4655_03685 [Serratia marcescens]|nr:hypothetical protein E4655_03685 [Serratia marcescens]
MGRPDFKSGWGRQRSWAGSTPVIFRQILSEWLLDSPLKFIKSINYVILLSAGVRALPPESEKNVYNGAYNVFIHRIHLYTCS